MIDLTKAKTALNNLDIERELIIQKSRDTIRLSKKVIYAMNRSNAGEAKSKLKECAKLTKELQKIIKESPTMWRVGIFQVAVQEYVEAFCYYTFVTEKKIPTNEDLDVDIESYLLGLCDLTGELERRAVYSVISKNFDEIKSIWETVSEIYSQFLELDMRNGELRKKSDAIKWNLKKIEEILYDLKIKNGIS